MHPSDLSRVLPSHTPALFRAAVAQAAVRLRAGEIVAVPTETVYGLAADARNAVAVAKIFAAKRRPACNPVIVHVASEALARACVATWPATAERLAQAFWPGPLTLVLPKAADIPDVVTAGGPTVGIRWPRHPFMQALLTACDCPLAAPSANAANRLSPTTAEHVQQSLGASVPLIVDGGPCVVGLESTVVDLTVAPPRVLRPGMVTAAALQAVLGALNTDPAAEGSGPRRSPGELPRHYAPRARLLVGRWTDAADLLAWLRAAHVSAPSTYVLAHTHLPSPEGLAGVSLVPLDPEAFARAFYAELHRADAGGAQTIVVEAVPDEGAWVAIADRLRRAAAGAG
jgi:L-threonylcarbamoyladenylate synthase